MILANYETLCFNTSAIAHGLPVVEVSYIATGPWHVNYVKANDPGLDYGIQLEDYVPYFCGLGYCDRESGINVQWKVQYPNVKSLAEIRIMLGLQIKHIKLNFKCLWLWMWKG